MSVKKLYVATWGNPLEWWQVTYNCGEREKKGFVSIVCVEADRYVVYMLDSALTASGRKDRVLADVKEVVKELDRRELVKMEENKEYLVISPRDAGRRREALREYGKAVARRLGQEVEVVATGAKGLYGGLKYSASQDQILGELLLGLWSQVESLGEAAETLEVRLDVTHGVNFMPTVALYVVRLLATVALLYGYSKVWIRVFNATPNEWSYEEMYSEEVAYMQFPWKPGNPALRALYYGAPLHYAKLCRQVDKPSYGTVPSLVGKTVHYVDRPGRVGYRDVYEQLAACAGCRDLRGHWGSLSVGMWWKS